MARIYKCFFRPNLNLFKSCGRPPSRPSSLGLLVGKNKHENTYFYKQNQKKSKDNDSHHNLYETTITARGRIQDFFKEGVVFLRIQGNTPEGKRSKAKGTREGEGWEWGRARVMFEYI